MLVSELSLFMLYLLPKKSTPNLKIGHLNLAQFSFLYIENHCGYNSQDFNLTVQCLAYDWMTYFGAYPNMV